jgi:hypothetical protein
MNITMTIARCFVLVLSAVLALPWQADTLIVTGGDLPNCTTVDLGEGECGHLAGQSCPAMKGQCQGCGTGTKQFVCQNGADACQGTGCTENQHHQSTNGDCITGSCS